MSLKGPKQPKRPKFSTQFSPVSHKLMTQTPKPETLLNIDVLQEEHEGLANDIKTTLRLIYSYVYDRTPTDDELTHYVNTAGTAYFEVINQEKLKDRNHRLKAGTVFCKIRNMLKDINRNLKSQLPAEEETCLLDFKSILTIQYNIYVTVLKTFNDVDKIHLNNKSNLDVDELKILPVTPKTKDRARKLYPTSPATATPTRLKRNDLIGKFVLEGDIKDRDGIKKARHQIKSPVKITPAVARKLLFSIQANNVAVPTARTQVEGEKIEEVKLPELPSNKIKPRVLLVKKKS